MPFAVVVIVVLVAWGVGAAVGSASRYLVGAVVGVVATLVILAVYGGIVARRSSKRDDWDVAPS
jgi:multisubunit Na+/H+ antiporter MnhE subunit